MKFSELEFRELGSLYNGVQARVSFPNGRGASVICHDYSYGGGEGLYEVLPLPANGEREPQGWLTEEQVELLLEGIASQPKVA